MQKILYVEDSPDARRLVRRLLADCYSVLEAEDGLTGIEMTSAEEPALILIDINIPFLDGYEVATKLKSLRPEVPVVALTADISNGARQRALAAGCDGYIPKPIDPDQFPAQVEVFLQGKREVLEQEERKAYSQAYQQKLAKRLEEKVRELTIRNQIADIFLTIPDEEIYREILQVILEAMESKCGIFGYIDEDGNLVTSSVTRDTWDQCQIPDQDNLFSHKTRDGIWSRAMREKKALYSNEPFRVPEGHIPILRAMTVPIVCRGELIGVITVANKAMDYDEKDQRLLETIAGSIAPILHARLQRDRQERERKRAEEALKRRLEQLVSLNQVSQAVTASLELDQVLAEIVSLASKVAASDHADVVLIDEEGRLGQSVEYLPSVLDIEHCIRTEGFTHWIIHSRQAVVVDDIDEDGTVSYRPPNGQSPDGSTGSPQQLVKGAPCTVNPLIVKAGVKSFVGLPLVAKDRLLGVLHLHSLRPGNFRDQLPLLTTFANQAAVAIENARLYESERKRATQLAVVNQVARRAASILGLDQLLQEVVTAIQQGFTYYNVALFLLDKVAGELVMRAIAGGFAEMAPPDHRLALGEEMAGWAAETGQTLLANDVSREPRYVLGILKESLTKAELCVPLKLADKVIGVLDIQSTQLNAFDETDLRAMETLTDQLAVAIENARLYQETVRRLKETEALGAVTTALTHSLDLDQVLQSIVDSATRLIPASTSGVLHFVDEAAGKLTPQATSAPGINVQKSMEIPIGKGIAGLAMQEKRLINVPNVEQDPRFLPLDTDTLKKSLLTAPLLIDGDCIGTLSLNSDQVGAFSADDERLLTTLAAQATIAVRNARLHQEVQHRVEELVFLNRVGRTVTSSLDLEQILTTVLEETALVLRTEAGSILLLDEESNELVFEAAVGPRAEGIKGLRFPLGQGIAGWAAREGQRLLVPDAREDPRFYPGIDGITSFVTRSVLAVPLKVKAKVIGVIEAVNKIEDDFSQTDVALLSSIAQPAAIAIENARLYEELQNRMEELKRTQAQLIQSAKLAAIGELAAGVAHEINNPLTSIVGFTRLLLQEIDDDATKEDLQIIDREAARTKAIVRGLLDFARQREPQLEQVDVNEIVQTTMALIRHQAKCARVTIKESYDETLPLVSLDADQIKQVFLNMMTNAIQAMPQGGELKVVTARRSQAQSPDGSTGSPQRLVKGMDSADYVVVEFHDTGTGISMENLPRIFDPFFTTKEVGQGTGLGLSISQSIVEKHRGKIKVESKVGRGSTFTVMLPVTEGEG